MQPSPEEVYLEALKGKAPPPPPEIGTKGISRRSFLAHHDAHPFALDVLLLKTFGPQYYDWEWETIRAELQRMFSTTVSELNFNKIEAMRTLHRAPDAPWSAWEVFEKIGQAVNNNIPLFDRMQRCSIEQCWHAARVLRMVRRKKFRGDVPRYVAAVFFDEGVMYCPKDLSFAREHVPQDPALIKAYNGHRAGDTVPETVVGVQLDKLLVAKQYVEMRDSQLRQQLALVKEVPSTV